MHTQSLSWSLKRNGSLPGVAPGGTLLSLRGWNRFEGSKVQGEPKGRSGSRRQIHPSVLLAQAVVNYQKRGCSLWSDRIPALPLRLSLRFDRFSLLGSAGSEAVNQPEKHGKRLISPRLRRGGRQESGEKRLVPTRLLRRLFCELIRCIPSTRTPTNKKKKIGASRPSAYNRERSDIDRSIKNKSTQVNVGSSHLTRSGGSWRLNSQQNITSNFSVGVSSFKKIDFSLRGNAL